MVLAYFKRYTSDVGGVHYPLSEGRNAARNQYQFRRCRNISNVDRTQRSLLIKSRTFLKDSLCHLRPAIQENASLEPEYRKTVEHHYYTLGTKQKIGWKQLFIL